MGPWQGRAGLDVGVLRDLFEVLRGLAGALRGLAGALRGLARGGGAGTEVRMDRISPSIRTSKQPAVIHRLVRL